MARVYPIIRWRLPDDAPHVSRFSANIRTLSVVNRAVEFLFIHDGYRYRVLLQKISAGLMRGHWVCEFEDCGVEQVARAPVTASYSTAQEGTVRLEGSWPESGKEYVWTTEVSMSREQFERLVTLAVNASLPEARRASPNEHLAAGEQRGALPGAERL